MAVELTEAGRKARAAYLREYRRKNKERIKDNATKHWNEVGARMEAEEEAAKNRRVNGKEGTSAGDANNETMSRTIIDAINAFSQKLELGFCDDWTPCERLLVYELIRKWNSCGRPHRFSVSNTELVKNTGFSRPTIVKARKELVTRECIEYTQTGNPRRAGQYSLELFFRLRPERAASRPEREEVSYLPTVGKQVTHYQSNSSRENTSATEAPPSAPAPLGRGARPARSEGGLRRVVNTEGRIFQIWPRNETGRRVVEEKKDGTLDEWKFEPSHSDEFIAEILSMSISEVKSG